MTTDQNLALQALTELRTELISRRARGYARNVADLSRGDITADEHRAANRRLRDGLTDAEWERAKATAFSAIDRAAGR